MPDGGRSVHARGDIASDDPRLPVGSNDCRGPLLISYGLMEPPGLAFVVWRPVPDTTRGTGKGRAQNVLVNRSVSPRSQPCIPQQVRDLRPTRAHRPQVLKKRYMRPHNALNRHRTKRTVQTFGNFRRTLTDRLQISHGTMVQPKFVGRNLFPIPLLQIASQSCALFRFVSVTPVHLTGACIVRNYLLKSARRSQTPTTPDTHCAYFQKMGTQLSRSAMS